MLRFVQKGYAKVKDALAKTQSLLSTRIGSLFKGKFNEDSLDQLEQLLYEADLGAKLAASLTESIRTLAAEKPDISKEELIHALREELSKRCSSDSLGIEEAERGLPTILLIVGVNGNGKTTSVAKLACRYQEAGKKPLIAAADTFRAAAIDQLEIWSQRLGIELVKSKPKSDPASVAFDAIIAGQSRHADAVLIDTAGRLHTKSDLMLELQKIRRVCNKAQSGAPHETLLVLDATTGQNALDQARTFMKFTPITGLILTKLDGTAKGGIVFAIQEELGIPVKFIGVGEGQDDLLPFDKESFISAIFD